VNIASKDKTKTIIFQQLGRTLSCSGLAMTGYLTFPKKAVGPGIPIKSHAQI
tara:strand:+ start:329 stop:484 length:156 start_codon:yes stop_codon:yes gene_type:complete